MPRPRTVSLLGPIALGILALVGCSSTADRVVIGETIEQVHELAVAAGYEESAAVLEDLVVSKAELELSAELLFSCFVDNGLTYTDHGFNPLDGWRRMYLWDGAGLTPDKAEESFENCQSRYLWYVEMGYELTNSDVVDPSVMADILECLRGAQLEFDRTAQNLREVLPGGPEDPNFDRVIGCANAATADFAMATIVL